MTSLKFKGDITLDEVFSRHRITIYDKLVQAIRGSYENEKIDEIKVINIEINNVEYSINLAKNKFISGLENAISFYEQIEEYEKCNGCLEIIKKIKEEQ